MATGSNSSAIESLVLRRHAELFAIGQEHCQMFTDCTPLLGVLRANYVINEMEYQRINAKQTAIEKNGCVRMI